MHLRAIPNLAPADPGITHRTPLPGHLRRASLSGQALGGLNADRLDLANASPFATDGGMETPGLLAIIFAIRSREIMEDRR
jgi:hypothetical protein